MSTREKIQMFLAECEDQEYTDTGFAIELLEEAARMLPTDRFKAGDRVEILEKDGGRTLHGRYLQPHLGGHLVALDLPYIGQWAVHDDNIIHEDY